MMDNCPQLRITGAPAEKLAKNRLGGKTVKVQAEIEIHKAVFSKNEPTTISIGVHNLAGVNLMGADEYAQPVSAAGPTKMHRSVHKAMTKIMGAKGM